MLVRFLNGLDRITKIFTMFSISRTMKGQASFFQILQGVKINEAVLPLEQESIIIKHKPNSFFKTELESKLRENGVTKLVIVGMMTHMCVDATVNTANGAGL